MKPFIMLIKLVLTLILLQQLFACTAIKKAEEAVADIEQTSVLTQTFPITRDQALSLIQKAFAEGWPDKTVSTFGNDGYEITLHFLIDRERIIARAVEDKGAYKFEVINRGTAPVTGNPARKKLKALLESKASAL